MKSFSQTINYTVEAGKSKIRRRFRALFFQGIISGMFIAMGAIGYFALVGHTSDPGIGKFLGALIFPTGIIGILLLSTELFTSNCLGVITVFKKEASLARYLKMLITVLVANFVGSIIMALLATGAGIFSQEMLELVKLSAFTKTNMPLGQMFISGILCNIIVCAGILMAYTSDTVIGKITALWFPIALFVLSGTEHIVANMFYFMMALFNGGDISLINIGISFLVVGLANFIGGGLIIGAMASVIDKDMKA